MARYYLRAIRQQLGYLPRPRRRPGGLHQVNTRAGSQPHPHNHQQPPRESEWKAKLMESGATALGSVVVLGLVGYGYHWYYKMLVLRKMRTAFAPGYSSAEEAALARHDLGTDDKPREIDQGNWIARPEQPLIDEIVSGTRQGQYYLMLGEKGTGKTSLLLHATKKVAGDGIALLEAHRDLEVFRLRLGKALNYDFHEDYIGGLFSFKGPRDASPLLDVERAFNKMEKVALQRRQQTGKPLVLIINQAHLLVEHDEIEGRKLLNVLQQRAELWAASRLVTVVFNSDDYWIEERLRPKASRLRVIPIHDVPKPLAMAALRSFRVKHFGAKEVPSSVLEHVYSRVGGRLRFLSHVARADDMEKACDACYDEERRWFLNQCWVYGADIDPHVEVQQDFCMGALILAKALVEKGEETGEVRPRIPLHEAREIMTRGDFIQPLDQLNIFFVDSQSMVQADSTVMHRVFRDVVRREGFEKHLDDTQERLDELEALGRTNELVFKEIRDGVKAKMDVSG